MFTDDNLRLEIAKILDQKPDATRKEIVEALYWRATLKWGRVPETVKIWYREYNSPEEIMAKYSPDQPRVPANNPDGGQWTRDPNSSEGGREARERKIRDRKLLEETSRPGSKFDVLKDRDGNYVRGATGELVKFPKDYPPTFFINEGEKNNLWRLVRTHPKSDLAGFTLLNELTKFGLKGEWDIQRRFNENPSQDMDHTLRDYSTIAIGLYAYGASIHPWLMNYIEASYAYFKGNKYSIAEPKGPLGVLPLRNAENTYIGFYLGERLNENR